MIHTFAISDMFVNHAVLDMVTMFINPSPEFPLFFPIQL